MRRPAEFPDDYRIEIAASVWGQIGTLSTAVFRRVQEELARVAEAASAEHRLFAVPRESDADRGLRVEDVTVVYRVEPSRRIIRLVGVDRSVRREG